LDTEALDERLNLDYASFYESVLTATAQSMPPVPVEPPARYPAEDTAFPTLGDPPTTDPPVRTTESPTLQPRTPAPVATMSPVRAPQEARPIPVDMATPAPVQDCASDPRDQALLNRLQGTASMEALMD